MSKIKIDFSQTGPNGFKIDPEGINFDRFKLNPVIHHNFDMGHVIGMAENIELAGDSMTMDIIFDEKDPDVHKYKNFLAAEGLIAGKPAGYVKTDDEGKVIIEFKLTSVSI